MATKKSSQKQDAEELGTPITQDQTEDNKRGSTALGGNVTTSATAGVTAGDTVSITRDGETFDANVTAVHPAIRSEVGVVTPPRIDVMALTGDPAKGGRERIEGITVGDVPEEPDAQPREVTEDEEDRLSKGEVKDLEAERKAGQKAHEQTVKAEQESVKAAEKASK